MSGPSCWLRRLLDGWAVIVPPDDAPSALASLAAYDQENSRESTSRDETKSSRPLTIVGAVVALLLYIDDSAHKHIRAFAVRPDGTLTNGRVLLDMASEDPGVPDGLKVDVRGNVFCTGPGGVWVCRANGALLGRVVLPELPANLAWAEDGSVLHVTARTSVYRLLTRTR